MVASMVLMLAELRAETTAARRAALLDNRTAALMAAPTVEQKVAQSVVQ
jgi:hypothetical protein